MESALTLTAKDCLNPELLQNIRKADFTGINFRYEDAFFAAPEPEALLLQIKNNLDAAGLVCPQVCLPSRGIMASCDYSDSKTEGQIEFALRTMPLLGAQWGAMQPLSAVNHGYCTEKAMEDNLQRFRKYLDFARQYGVGIAVENPMPLQEQEIQRFCAEPETLCTFVDQLDRDNVGICWNFGHASHLGRDSFGRDTKPEFDHAAAVEQLGSRIKAIHLSDNFGDGHWRLPPGIGKLGWFDQLPNLLAILLRSGFSGFLTLDCDLEQGRHFPGLESAYITLCAEAAASYTEEAQQRLGGAS